MKTKLIIFLLGFFLLSFGQEKIRIDFNNTTIDDYDLMINEILNLNGYSSFVEYKPTSSERPYDLLIKYETKTIKDNDFLSSYSMELYDKNGGLIRQIKKNIPFLNRGINEYQTIQKGLNNLFQKDFKINKANSFKKISNFNISFTVHKLDSATYSITAKGAGIRTLVEVENALLKKAGQYLDYYDYYLENGKYNYYAPGPGSYLNYSGFFVQGIIKGNPKESKQINKLTKIPEEFLKEFPKN